jgi:hypothetical protein
MCEISDKLKLCTCKKDVSKLKYTWHYYRFVGNKEGLIYGEIMAPFHLEEKLEAQNLKTLTALLNDGNIFDVEISPKPKDRLRLVFDLSVDEKDSSLLTYEFKYTAGRWKPCESEPFYHENYMKQVAKGKIVDGFTNLSMDGVTQTGIL